MNPRRATLERLAEHPAALLAALVVLPLGLRVALAAFVGVAPDEAYYFGWSRDLAAWYPDHPPAVAWLIAASTWLAGEALGDVLALRLPALVIGGLALPFALYWLGREAGVAGRELPLLLLATVASPLGVAAALLITPDVPLILCWTLAAALALRATRLGGTAAWALAGLAAGGALLSKHSGWILIASIAAGAIADPAARRQLRRPGPWLGLALALVVAAPNLAADASMGFPSLGFQLGHGLGPAAGSSSPIAAVAMAPVRLLELLAGQVGLLTPLVAWACWRALRRGPPPRPAGVMLWVLALAPLAVFCAAALLAHPEANWPAPAHPLLLALALAWLGVDRERHADPGRHRRFAAAAVLSSAALTALAAVHLLWPLPGFPPAIEPAARLRAWDDLPGWLTRARGPLLAEGYELAAALSFHLPGHPVVRTRCDADCSADAIGVVAEPGTPCAGPPAWFRRPGHRVAALGDHAMRRRDGAVVRRLCGYRLVPLGGPGAAAQ